MAYDGSLKFDTKIDSTGFAGGIAQLKSTALAAIGAIGAAFASGAIAKALIGQISLVEQYGSAINDQSQKISISAKAYQELSYLFEQTGGNADVLQMGIKTLSNAVVDGSKAFETLGISLEDARAMSQEDLFDLVLTQLAEMPPSAERTAAAVDLLGRSATELNPLFNLGADGIAKMKQQAQEYGIVMTDEAVAATDAYGDAVTLAQKSGEALRNAMVGKMLPALTKVADGFADIAKEATEAFNARGVSGVVDVITDKFPVATAAVSGLAAAFAALLIIKTIQSLTAGYIATEALLTAGLKYGTLAQWNELGALSAKQIVVAALSGKIGVVTAAQWLWNAAIAANPVMLLVVAIGALVGGVILLTKNFDTLYPTIAETREELDALDESMQQSAKTFDETLEAAGKQRDELSSTVEILDQLSKAYSGSTIEQQKMQALCDMLNSSVDGLNISFNKQTGELSSNVDAIKDQISAQYELARASAASARYQELVAAQLDAQYVKRQAQAEFDKYHAKDGTRLSNLDFGSGFYAAGQTELNLAKATTGVDDATTALEEFDSFLQSVGVNLGAMSGKTAEVDESLNVLGYRLNDTADAQERVIIAGYDVTDVLGEMGLTADQASSRFGNLTGAATNMFEKIDTKARIRVKTMIENLTANTAAIEQWGDNIALLGSKLPEDLLQPLIDQGPEKMAGVLNALAQASPEELDALVAQFKAGGEAAREAWLQSLGAGTSAEEDPLATVLEGSTDAVKKAGEEAGAALVQSISEQDYTEATGTMTDAFTEAFRQIKEAFAEMLQRIHYDLAYAIGGVSIDIAQMARDVNAALSSIKTSITIRVNTIYTSEGSPSGGAQRYDIFGHPLAKGMDYIPYDGYPAILHKGEGVLTASEASLWRKIKDVNGASAATVNTARVASVGASAGKTVNVSAPITVQGVTESPAKLAAKVTKNLQEALYGNT